MLRFTSLQDLKGQFVNIDLIEYESMKRKYRLLDENGLEKYIESNMERLGINEDEAKTLKKAIILGYHVDYIISEKDGDTKDPKLEEEREP